MKRDVDRRRWAALGQLLRLAAELGALDEVAGFTARSLVGPGDVRGFSLDEAHEAIALGLRLGLFDRPVAAVARQNLVGLTLRGLEPFRRCHADTKARTAGALTELASKGAA